MSLDSALRALLRRNKTAALQVGLPFVIYKQKPTTEAQRHGENQIHQIGDSEDLPLIGAGERGSGKPILTTESRRRGEDRKNKTLPLIYPDNTDQHGKPKARTYRGSARMNADQNSPSFAKTRKDGHPAQQG